MVRHARPLAPSEPKSRFFQETGLRAGHEESENVYNMLKAEAIRGRQRLISSESNLAAVYHQHSLPHPWSYSQMDTSALNEAAQEIYAHARPETKPYYDLGWFRKGSGRSNWVILWLIWHVFRYRDGRNHRTKERKGLTSAAMRESARRGLARLDTSQGSWMTEGDEGLSAGTSMSPEGTSSSCDDAPGLEQSPTDPLQNREEQVAGGAERVKGKYWDAPRERYTMIRS